MKKTEEIINLINKEIEGKDVLFHEMLNVSLHFYEEGDLVKAAEFDKYATEYLTEYMTLKSLLSKVEDLVKEGK